MNEPHVTTFMDRVRNAIRAFKGEPIGSLTFGVDVKKCSECGYAQDSIVLRQENGQLKYLLGEKCNEYKNPPNILYCCDGEACDGGCPNAFCEHTRDIRHARNFEFVSGVEMYVERLDQTLDKKVEE